ncbi:DUF7455 domain-containing protein [Saccharopolyspora thermophila]|nr:hypothetical protein [Saccharopolyspora subtropica]
MLTQPKLPRRTPVDACDRCEHDARIRAVLPTGGELLFCSDHLLEHVDRLRELDVDVRRVG